LRVCQRSHPVDERCGRDRARGYVFHDPGIRERTIHDLCRDPRRFVSREFAANHGMVHRQAKSVICIVPKPAKQLLRAHLSDLVAKP
jgi:hypothetical protein